MGKFTYNYLKSCANKDIKLGNWKNRPVYAISAKDAYKSDNYVFVVYDNKNAVLLNGYNYGYLDEEGNVHEAPPILYAFGKKEEKKASPKPAVPEKKVPATGEYSVTVATDEFFSKLDREINELLAGAEDWEPKLLQFEGV